MHKLNLTIDGRQVEAWSGQTVLQAALKADIYIPHLCFHPDLQPQGGCKLCVVEIEGLEGAVTSCTTEARAGMVVSTKSEHLKAIRRLALELMLASHPSDCTSCPAYLNCELQAMAQYLGVAHSRLRRIDKQNTGINTGNPLIVRDMERCIQCGRCLRACEEIRGVGILKYNQKDGETYIGTEGDLPLREADCRFCGACVEVCPTGALRDAEGVFARESPREKALIPCSSACPAAIDIPAYVRYVSQGKYSAAVGVIREKAPFPLALGYVCNHKCETACRRAKLNSPLSIRNLKRFAVENDREQIWRAKAEQKMAATGKRVGIIGAGPAGLTAAYHLAKKGHAVTVYEKLPLAGGMMAVGIPAYRLPGEVIAREVEFIKNLGVEIITNTAIDSLAVLKNGGYGAILIAVGTHRGRLLPAPGMDLNRVYTAVDFLRKVALKEEIGLGEKIAVVGGGNVAFDCARTALRLGAKQVEVLCLETREAMPADPEEIQQAEEEGVKIRNSKSVLAIEGTNDGPTRVKHIEASKFSFADDGQLTIEARAGSEGLTEADMVIVAAGQYPHLDQAFGVELGPGNLIAVNQEDLSTTVEGVYAAGDAVSGTKSVIEAIAAGRQAASSIDAYLGGNGAIDERLIAREKPDGKIGKRAGFAREEREETVMEKLLARKSSFCRVDLGFDQAKAAGEAGRCLQCDLRLDISKVKFWGDYKCK